jgi:hypothetical protein
MGDMSLSSGSGWIQIFYRLSSVEVFFLWVDIRKASLFPHGVRGNGMDRIFYFAGMPKTSTSM